MKKKKGQYSKLLVTLILIFGLAFTVAVLFVFWHTGAEPGILVASVFAALFGELWVLAGIKKTKEKNKEGKQDELG